MTADVGEVDVSEHVGAPATSAGPVVVLYQVRVPVVFDHLNAALRQQLRDRDIRLKQALGRGVAIMGDVAVGKIEIWFELTRASTGAGRQQAADDAIDLVEQALARIGLEPTPNEQGLGVVHNQVITTALTT